MLKCKLCNSDINALNLDDVNLQQCSKCGLISDHVMYDDAFLKNLYSEMYSGNTYYNAHIDEFSKLAKGGKVRLGWHKKVVLKIINKTFGIKDVVHVLEFGAGVGVIGAHYKNDKRIKYKGIELDNHATQLARTQGCDIEQGSITNWKDETGKYDFIFSFEVMEHIVDLKKAINNIRSLLKEDGILIFSTPNYYRRKNYNDNKLHQEQPPVHVNFFSKDNLPSVFEELGMKVNLIFERPYPFLTSPKSHWIRVLTGRYFGATLVAIVAKK